MRNQPKPLNYTDAMRAYRLRERLEGIPEGTPVILTYVKRNGESSATVGTVAGFSGADGMDTMSVTLDSETKGHRTINLARVTDMMEVADPE